MVDRLRIMNKNPRWGIFFCWFMPWKLFLLIFFLLLTIPLSYGGMSATQWIPAVAGMTKFLFLDFLCEV